MGEVIKAKLDIIFKKLFTENIDLLHDFLASVLQVPYDSIKNIEIQNPEILPNVIGGKLSRMDIKLKVDDRLVNVEMQCSSEKDFKDRALFLWAQLFAGELKSGDQYGLLRQSICINVLDFIMFDSPGFYSDFTVMERVRHEALSDKCAILFLELPKIGKEIHIENRLELWLKVINSETAEEWEMLQNTGVKPIQQAVYTLRQMSKDERIRELAHQREIAAHDEASRIAGAWDKGIAEGMARGMTMGIARGKSEGIAEGMATGIAEATAKFVEKLLKRNRPVDEIMEDTGLTREQIERLRTT
jgi:predicted transposase/invertase (TIGR01784 family)